jgi:hypothetical protein
MKMRIRMKNNFNELINLQELFNGIKDYILDHGYTSRWDYAISLNTNKKIDDIHGEKLLREFHAKLDRRIFGKQYSKVSSALRTRFILLPALGPDSATLHYHGFYRLADVSVKRLNESKKAQKLYHPNNFTNFLSELWKNHSNGGSSKIESITSENGWISYSCTEINDFGRIIFGDLWSGFVDSNTFINKKAISSM